MRYTTIIDISEFQPLYKNHATRLVYLHLVLRSGYHDYDRDCTTISIRRLAWETGLSVGAVRNALEQLAKFQMIKRTGTLTQVRKFILEQPISKRAKNKKQEAAQAAAAERQERERRQEEERQRTQQAADALRAQGKTSFMVYYEEQEAAAAAGDTSALEFINNNRSTYELHKKSFQK